MQPSGEAGRFEVVDLPSPPADRKRSVNEMRTIILIVVSLFIASPVLAVQPLELKLDSIWQRRSDPPPSDGWSWRTWRNERGDLLTIAEHTVARTLTSYGDLDRAMDFASSAYPVWLDKTGFPSWADGDDFNPRFLKLKKDSIRNPMNADERVPIISYVMVNDSGKQSLMAVGAVVCKGNLTCYIQHNSKQPISDVTVNATLDQIVSQTRSTQP